MSYDQAIRAHEIMGAIPPQLVRRALASTESPAAADRALAAWAALELATDPEIAAIAAANLVTAAMRTGAVA